MVQTGKVCSPSEELVTGGVVARFDPGSIWAAFPAPPSRHHGVGLWPAEFGHPVEDVTPDHGLTRLCDAVPRL